MRYPIPDSGLIMNPVRLRREGESYREALDRHAADMLRRASLDHYGEPEKAAADLGLTLEEFQAERARVATHLR